MIEFKAHISPKNLEVIHSTAEEFKKAAQYRYKEPERYTEILNELYAKESRRRVLNLQKVQEKPEFARIVLNHIAKRENIVDFMVDWCWTYDPRNANIGLPPSIPWIPWMRQVEFIEWFYNLYLNQKSGIIEKSRDQGATWLFCLITLQEWRWVEGFAGGIGSNKLDNVDKRDNPDCIFEKMRTLLRYLPKFWFPKEWDPRKHDKIANLINPENGANVSGQGGQDIGRGGRRSFYFVDESASLEFPKAVDASLSQNTNCQFDLSTPKGMNHFGQKRHSGRVPIFTFSWRDDPRKDKQWYDKEVERLDPVVVAQEIDIDYYASVDGLFIEPKWVRAAIDFKLPANGVRSAGLDVAAGGANNSSLCLRSGPVARVLTWNIENGVDLVHHSFGVCNEHESDYLNYDVIGVGHAVYSVAERTDFPISFAHYAIRANDAPSDRRYPEFKNRTGKEIFFNSRAELWYNVAMRFKKTYDHKTYKKKYPPEEMISIENDGNLVAQLSAPMKFTTDAGKIKCESKEQMLKRGIKSPDEADALVLAFAPQDAGNIHVVEGYTNASSSFQEFVIGDKPSSQRQIALGAICMLDDLTMNGVCAIWNEVEGRLYIYDEVVFERPIAREVASVFADKMRMRQFEVEKIMGNDMMFAEGRRSMMKEINDEFWNLVGHRQSVKIKPPKHYDPIGSLSIINRMIQQDRLRINTTCREMHRQLSSWRLEGGKMKETGMREAILMLCSELRQHIPIEEVLKKMEYVSHLKQADKGVEEPLD